MFWTKKKHVSEQNFPLYNFTTEQKFSTTIGIPNLVLKEHFPHVCWPYECQPTTSKILWKLFAHDNP
jgi:hypothetical protein